MKKRWPAIGVVVLLGGLGYHASRHAPTGPDEGNGGDEIPEDDETVESGNGDGDGSGGKKKDDWDDDVGSE